MSIINIFIAIIVTIGFWKSSSKEQERKIANATFTKTVILLLLSVWTLFFYYKSYQVATFKNYIRVEGHKGIYETKRDSFPFQGDTIIKEYYCSKDVINEIILASRFSNKRIGYHDPITNVIENDKNSRIRSYCVFSNRKGELSELYHRTDTIQLLKDHPEIKHLYDIEFYSNTIPSIFPFTIYEEDYKENEEFNPIIKNTYSQIISKKPLSNANKEIGYDYDKLLLSRLITHEIADSSKTISLSANNYAKNINTLNFFSAADLSQCNFEISVESDIPVNTLSLYFDIPIETSSLNIDKNKVSSRSFVFKDLKSEYGKVNDFRFVHINFPTLSNLQLIRSLILTTILTALLSLTITNIYYYSRKKYKKYIRHHTISFAFKRKLVRLWIPVGEIILWSIVIVFAYLLSRAMCHKYYSISYWSVRLTQISTLLVATVYIILIITIFSILSRKGIYPSDITTSVRNNLVKVFNKLKKIIFNGLKQKKIKTNHPHRRSWRLLRKCKLKKALKKRQFEQNNVD